MKVTLKGNRSELAGVQPIVGQKAPAFSIENLYNKQVSLESLAKEKVLLSVFPNIETSVCEKQTKEFFKKASDYPDLRIINISNNTQAQLQKWCAVQNIEVEMLSDTKLEFAKAYGLYAEKFDVLARSVFVIDQNGDIVYMEILKEMTDEPNYKAAFEAVEQL